MSQLQNDSSDSDDAPTASRPVSFRREKLVSLGWQIRLGVAAVAVFAAASTVVVSVWHNSFAGTNQAGLASYNEVFEIPRRSRSPTEEGRPIPP